jgi:uncharacterized protein YndB with AHSA1/START domain
MKIVQWAFAVFGAIALAVLITGLFLPSKFNVERSTDINAPASKIYDYIHEPQQWSQWAVWNKRDREMRVRYSGPRLGKGAKWSWQSRSEGTGSMEFTHVEPDRLVAYALTLPDYGLRSNGVLRLEPAGKVTRVTWTNEGDVGSNPLKHYLPLLMDRMVGPDFEASLANLKALAERS